MAYDTYRNNIKSCCEMTIVLPSVRLQLEQLEKGALKVNTFVAKVLTTRLNATLSKLDKLHGNDVYTTYRLIVHILRYENQQNGLNLTHTQDRNFIQVGGHG